MRLSELAEVPFKTPSDQLIVQGPVPVSATWITLELPLQLVALPLTTDVGRVRTVITIALDVPWADPQPEEVTVQAIEALFVRPVSV